MLARRLQCRPTSKQHRVIVIFLLGILCGVGLMLDYRLRRWPNIVLDYRLRRWPNIDTALSQLVNWLASTNALYNIEYITY